MENYNRLFLLQDPAEGDHDDAVDQLRGQIMKGDDVTNPADKIGRISLSQLNTYSGEVDIQALTNFKAVKIDSVTGNVYETNLAKLLIELQEVGGLEDAREEGLIDAKSILRDADIHGKDENQAATAYRAAETFMFIVEDLEEMNYTIPSGGAVGVPYPHVSEYSVPTSFKVTLESPDGVRTKFVASYEDADGNGQLGFGKDRIIVTLNGVVQDINDGAFLFGDIGGGIDAYYGFEFHSAPVAGDEVAFMFDSMIRGAIQFELDSEAITTAYSGAVESNYASFESDILQSRGVWQNLLDTTSYSAETAYKKQGYRMISDAIGDIESANTEGDIANALTGATAGWDMVFANHNAIVQLKSQEELNGFKLDTSSVKLMKNGEAIKDLNSRLGKEASEANAKMIMLETLRQDAEAAQNDDGSGN